MLTVGETPQKGLGKVCGVTVFGVMRLETSTSCLDVLREPRDRQSICDVRSSCEGSVRVVWDAIIVGLDMPYELKCILGFFGVIFRVS
jgi:hypothetical protein